jgi:hypothetical protein
MTTFEPDGWQVLPSGDRVVVVDEYMYTLKPNHDGGFDAFVRPRHPGTVAKFIRAFPTLDAAKEAASLTSTIKSMKVAELNRLARLVERGVWAENMREVDIRIFDRIVARGYATREEAFTETTRNPPISSLHYIYRPTDAGVALVRAVERLQRLQRPNHAGGGGSLNRRVGGGHTFARPR